MRMRTMNLKSELFPCTMCLKPTICYARYTDEEIKTFEAIMKLERGFKSLVNACAADTDAFILLIGQVSGH